MGIYTREQTIQYQTRRGILGCKRAVYISQNVADGWGIKTQRVKVNEISSKHLKIVGRGLV